MAVYLFTDFGAADLYLGQAKATLHAHGAPEVIDLFNDAPACNVKAGAHLLAALLSRLPPGGVVMAVVDPGVGTARDAIVMAAEGRWLVGPDNGLLSVAAARAREVKFWRILWRPGLLSSSFHGRDLFAPIAAEIARSGFPQDKLEQIAGLQVQLGASDLAEIIYVDHYGNAITGIRAENIPRDAMLRVTVQDIQHARVFAESEPGAPFWYENSIGLVELAANQESAARELALRVGDPVHLDSK